MTFPRTFCLMLKGQSSHQTTRNQKLQRWADL